MKAKTASPETAVLTAERKLHNTWVYIKRHWQLYLLFLLPAVALTLVFKYAPMGGVLIAFQKYNPFKGIWQGAGWASIMYTASLSNASKDLKEAAMIDGANLIQQIMTVEWPAIKDMVVIQFILQAGNIMSIGFEKAYALQTDLNLNTAEIIATYVYKKGLLDGDYSFSTAVGLFNTVVNVILLIAVNKVVAKMNDGKGL